MAMLFLLVTGLTATAPGLRPAFFVLYMRNNVAIWLTKQQELFKTHY